MTAFKPFMIILVFFLLLCSVYFSIQFIRKDSSDKKLFDLIPNNTAGGIAPEINAGLYFNTKGLQLGLSANNLIAPKTSINTTFATAKIQFTRYYTAMALYNIAIGKNFSLSPSALLKTDFIYYQTDFNLILQFNTMFM